MHRLSWFLGPLVLSLLFWSAFVACIDAPLPDHPPAARIVTAWDPLACTGDDPYRVVVELEDDGGVELAASTTCRAGMVVLDAPHFGLYRGRIYAWQLADTPVIRSEMSLHLAVDETIVRWWVSTPQ
jgi:hypothetical protein